MTNERAIELLHRISDSQFDGIHGDERRKALEMAVRALVSQQTVNDSQGLVNDCISRKMAIDEVKRLHDVAWANWKETRISANTMIDALKDLPSAQPTQTNADSTQTNALDCVSRQAAIEAVNGLPKWSDDLFSAVCLDYSDVISVLSDTEQLPPAQLQRKKGKWINHRKDDGHNIADCDQCGNAIQWFDGDEIPRYCCMCGADMRGESDED